MREEWDDPQKVGRELLRAILEQLSDGPKLDTDLSEQLWKKYWGSLASPLIMRQALHYLRTLGWLEYLPSGEGVRCGITELGRKQLATV
ncbi:MAG: hypothetical protein A2Z11_04705 [Candidatus Woykebacteria bacterium RBG_16_43_9]|uniref:Uncharacterized protein n=1 Tax=Candidatus Woykebacteria bacterium RBG_16_43_9 TaxID=1802596 RepID=A0A1G1WEA1_9BACT|nr:MAG: hypothetical protein A2Z11_04705 [Candidatus Woykebacteria bacterium RBG_16_43_9]